MRYTVPVFPWPMHPKVAEVLEAIPDITLVEAQPGGPGPILAIGKRPTFACDCVVVTAPEKAAQGVDIITQNGIEMVTMGQILGLKELQPERVEPKVRFK